MSLKRSKKRPVSLPAWLKAIPEGSHGSGTIQKRLWRLKSDYVRIRDWHGFGGKCIATGVYIPHWSAGQAGHFKAWSKCNGMFKFNEMNINLQSAKSNSFPDMDTWKHYATELTNRAYEGIIKEIEETNRMTPLPIRTPDVMDEIYRTLSLIQDLPEKPPYWERVNKLYLEEQLKNN